MSSVEVVLPFRGGCPHRERALAWVSGRYRWPVTVAEGPDPWVKARAVAPAIAASTADVIVVADADVWCEATPAAVAAVEAGEPWAMPHDTVHRLTAGATARAIGGAALTGLPLDEPAYPGMWGGGIVAMRRETYLDVPLDPRFVGWGCEDISWAMALHYLAGPGWRGTGRLWHLWHPPQDRPTRRHGSAENEHLMRRYRAARRDLRDMRALVNEVNRDALPDHQQADHDPPRDRVAH